MYDIFIYTYRCKIYIYIYRYASSLYSFVILSSMHVILEAFLRSPTSDIYGALEIESLGPTAAANVYIFVYPLRASQCLPW